MGSRTSALVAVASVLASNVAMAEIPRSTATIQPVAYHVQMARTSLPTQTAQRAAPAVAPLPEQVRASVGCLITGTAGTIVAGAFGGDEILSVIAGGGLPPTNRVIYMTGLLTVVFVSFCAVGQAMEPLYTHLKERSEVPAPDETIQIHRRHPANLRDVSYRTEAGNWPRLSKSSIKAQPQNLSFRASLRQSIAETGR